jgi:tetratricopeptide (TPR) repeat protein
MKKAVEDNFKKGRELYMHHQYAEAMNCYSKAIKLKPSDDNLYFLRGLCKKELKDFAGELEDYSTAININPQNKKAYINRAFCRQKLKDIKGALDDSIKVIEIDPSCMRGFSMASYYYSRNDNKKEGRKTELKATQITPVSAEDYYQYAVYKNELTEQIEFTSIAMEMHFHDACSSLVYIADCKTKMGKYEEAMKDYNKAIGLSPDSSRHYLYYYSIARCKERFNYFEEALEFYDKSIEYNSLWFLPVMCRGQLKIKLGRIEEGNADIQKYHLLRK